jgi:hypothetical protein
MITIVLIFAAALVLGGKDLTKVARSLSRRFTFPAVTWQQIAAAALVAVALATHDWQGSEPPVPPQPTPVAPLDLSGLFTGQHGAADAALVSALTGELAEEIAWDGQQEKPVLATGAAIDTLRKTARELRCRGVSIGARQPAARDAIARHLDVAVGNDGGPIDQAKRAAWVKALAEISEAAADVTR